MSKIDDILKEAEENGIAEEVRDQIESLEYENLKLKEKNRILQIEKSNSKANQYRKSNKNLKEKNKKLSEQVDKLLKKKQLNLGHLSREELGVYNRMLDDFEAMQNNQRIIFPDKDHPVFNRFFELANKYPNRDFIVTSLREKVNEKIDLINIEIEAQYKNIELIKKCEEMINEYPDTWESEVDDKMAYLYRVTSVEEIEKKIKQLRKDVKEVDKWFTELKKNIHKKPTRTTAKVKNNLYNEIFNEFDNVYDFCTHVGGMAEYHANIHVDSFNKDDLYWGLARELEKQLGLCEEPNTHKFYYSNGEGRLVPYELNRRLLQYINKNTTFIKYDGKKNKYKSGNIIDSEALFVKVPKFCHITQHKNENLVGFNNCFYDVENNQIVHLNPQVPILPLKNTKVELYLKEDNQIEDNPMKEIFDKCFTEADRKTILAYIGCALFDKGYTQRQEFLFIMGKGGCGKSTFVKAICSIFYKVGHQLVSKFKDSNEFGFSVFLDSDVVIVDEIQSAPKEFANKLKNIASTDDLPVERKHFDTVSVPATNVPRVFLIGNNFSKKLYEESDGAGIKRRMLVVIPIRPIQELGYQWKDLIQSSCQQWLVQAAIEEYQAQNLHKKSIPIGSEGDYIISDADKDNKLEMCTYPEQFFIKQHFEIAYDDNGNIDTHEMLKYSDVFAFIREHINKNMVEATCKETATNMFIGELNNALKLENRSTRTIKGEYYFTGVIPKSEEAIAYFSR